MDIALSDPQQFDELLNNPGNLDAVMASIPETELGRVRRIQLQFSQGDPGTWREMIRELSTLNTPPARGVSLAIQASLNLHEEVLATEAEADPVGTSPLELEDACGRHAALGIAAAQTGQHARALQHLRVALTLARALQLRFRAQMLEIEWLRVRNLTGDPAPEDFPPLLIQPMARRRRSWGRRTHAEALMSLGAYRDALMALGTPDGDTPADAALRELLHVQCVLPPARDDGDPILSPELPCTALARSMRRVVAGQRNVDLSWIVGEPQATYARLVEAGTLVQTPGMVGASARLLGSEPPAPADQAMMWAMIRMGAAIDGAGEVDLLATMRVLEREMMRVRHPCEVLRLMRIVAPRRVALILLSPLGERIPAPGLPAQALLVGQSVIYGGEHIRLPGRTGRTVVLEEAQVEIRDDLARQERKRLAEALVAFGGERAVVNMGWVLRGFGTLRQAARCAGDAQAEAVWDACYGRVFEMLSPEVQEALITYPPAYLK